MLTEATCPTDLRYTDLPGLESTINSAYSTASQRLLDILLEKFRLLDHLRALKDYMMLGQGDFVDHLMEAVGSVDSAVCCAYHSADAVNDLTTDLTSTNQLHPCIDTISRHH